MVQIPKANKLYMSDIYGIENYLNLQTKLLNFIDLADFVNHIYCLGCSYNNSQDLIPLKEKFKKQLTIYRPLFEWSIDIMVEDKERTYKNINFCIEESKK